MEEGDEVNNEHGGSAWQRDIHKKLLRTSRRAEKWGPGEASKAKRHMTVVVQWCDKNTQGENNQMSRQKYTVIKISRQHSDKQISGSAVVEAAAFARRDKARNMVERKRYFSEAVGEPTCD